MNFSQFFARENCVDLFKRQSSICFVGGGISYPLLFFSLVIQQLKHSKMCMIQAIDIAEETELDVQSKLETSFLGMRSIYFLKNLAYLSDIKREKFITYLTTYTGPNNVVFFLPSSAFDMVKSNKNVCAILLKETIDKTLFLKLMSFFRKDSLSRNTKFIDELFKRYRTFPLDRACLLIHYINLVGRQGDHFIRYWLDALLTPEKSLFTLSQHFFAKNVSIFCKQWLRVASEYSQQFWVSFWSEQLWRAHFFVVLSREKNFSGAKRVGFRLPFSYLQRDWRGYSTRELRQAHQFVYNLDFSFKNGGTPLFLDLFYSKFFIGDFSR